MTVDVFATLRRAMEQDARSRYQLSRESGIEESALSRFANRKRGLALETAAKLADVLGLEIIVQTKRSKRRKGR